MNSIPTKINSNSKSRSRSSTGCLTCKKKKRKCDEKLYPVCLNCQNRKVSCEWSMKSHQFHQQKGQVKYYGNEDDDLNVSHLEPSTTTLFNVDPISIDSDHHSRSTTPPTHSINSVDKKSQILQRIAMQEDCVDDQESEMLIFPQSPHN